MNTLLNSLEIQSIIPHRYPFQMIDKVIDYKKGQEITAVKAVTIGEGYFAGHFPELPIMPGVLIVEALAQTTSVFLQLTGAGWNPGDDIPKKETALIGVLGSIKVNMIKPVFPGCFLYLNARLDWNRENASSLKVEAYVEDELCAQGSIIVSLQDKLKLSN